MAMSKGRFALAVVSLAVGIAALGDSQAQAPGSANACIATVPPSGKLCTDVESCRSSARARATSIPASGSPMSRTTGRRRVRWRRRPARACWRRIRRTFSRCRASTTSRRRPEACDPARHRRAPTSRRPACHVAELIRHNYTVRVGNCYRPHIDDTEAECGFVLKAMRVIEKYPERRRSGSQAQPAEPWSRLAGRDAAQRGPPAISSSSMPRAGTRSTEGRRSRHSALVDRSAARVEDARRRGHRSGGRGAPPQLRGVALSGAAPPAAAARPRTATKYYPACGKPNCK
jgi:hypothetical protein